MQYPIELFIIGYMVIKIQFSLYFLPGRDPKPATCFTAPPPLQLCLCRECGGKDKVSGGNAKTWMVGRERQDEESRRLLNITYMPCFS